MGHLVINSHADNFEPKIAPRHLRSALDHYDPKKHATIWGKTAGKQNWIHSGLFTYQLALQWGDMDGLNTWHAKQVAGLEVYELASRRNFKQTGTLMAEVGDILFTPLHVLVLLGKEDMGKKTLDALGFCRGDGDAGFNPFWSVISKHIGALGTFPKEANYAM